MAIGLLAVPTDATDAGRVPGVHQDHRHPSLGSFVGDECPELEEGPRKAIAPLGSAGYLWVLTRSRIP